jgi:hypothetical protein
MSRGCHRGQERCDAVLVDLVARFGPLQGVWADDEASDILRDICIFGQGKQGGIAMLGDLELADGIEECCAQLAGL